VARLAFYTFGILREPRGHPQVQGFSDRSPGAVESAKGTDGFIALLGDRPVDFGPRFYDPAVDGGAPQTLSLWTNLESVFAFAYRGRHAEALRGRKEWFKEPNWPTYAAWWVADDYMPTWYEAAERLEHLHNRGPTPFAFSFKQAFDAAGLPTVVNRASVDEVAPTVR
jgi:hypothetical protein